MGGAGQSRAIPEEVTSLPGRGGAWQIWTDTGGTFTDCLAVDPEGNLHRAKVLSTSAVRGRIAGVDRDAVHLATDWNLPQGFFRGFTFRLLGRESEPRTIED